MLKRIGWLAALGLGFTVLGCGNKDNAGENQANNAPATSTATTGGNAGEKMTIAVIPKGSTHEFWKHVHAGANEAGTELGVEIMFNGPEKEDDKESQIRMVENMVNKGVKGIVLAPLDDQALVHPVEEATKAGIPVLIIDSGLKTDKYVSFVATDNEAGGHMAGKRMIELLGGKGKIVVLRYQAGSASTDAREKGFIDEIKASAPGITIVSDNQFAGATRETAEKASENLLASYRKQDGSLDLDGIYTPNESSTFGMMKVLEANKWAGKVKFVGFDAAPELIEGLQKDEIMGLVVQNPERMGHDGVKTLVEFIKGNKNVEKRIDTGATMVTKDNLNQPDVQKLLAAPKE